MGRWAALVMASACISRTQAFLLPFGGRSTTKPAVGARPQLTSQTVPRCRALGVQGLTVATRSLKTRVCAGLEGFSGQEDFDRFLGELIFSQSDVRDDVLKNLDKAGDEGFMTWLKQKMTDCKDLEERVGIKSLYDIIVQVKEYVGTALEEEEAEKAAKEVASEGAVGDAEVVGETGTKRTNAQVWEEMRRLQRLGVEALQSEGMGDAAETLKQARMSPFEGLPDKVRAGYEDLLAKLLDRSSGESLEEVVAINYEQFDVQFLTLLNQKAQAAAGTDEGVVYAQIGTSINEVMKKNMEKASQRMQAILSAGNPTMMEQAVTTMAGRGEVDDALILLLQANLEQAESAGAKPAVEVLTNLVKAAQAAKDEQAEPEKRLLRQLLRTEDRDQRLAFLTKAFRQHAKMLLTDGTETSNAPDVAPPKFIETVKSVIRNFGNVGEAEVGFADKLDEMISDAEQVATELYGETQTPQDQQDRAWKDTTVSVFDLENMEEDGSLRGEEMPWANDQYDGMTPEMVKNFQKNDEGNLQIGGS